VVERATGDPQRRAQRADLQLGRPAGGQQIHGGREVLGGPDLDPRATGHQNSFLRSLSAKAPYGG
jgi:hypothetical protein